MRFKTLTFINVITGAVALLASFVMFGWLIKSGALVQIHPDLVPMQFNTALCFLMSALALGLYEKNKLLSKLLCTVSFSIAFLTILEYLFGLNVGLDTLFIDPFTETKTSHPGRMAPNTAFCFALFALFILLTHQNKTKLWSITVSMPCIYGILGSISLVGYIFGIEQAYAWGTLTHMALHTSIGFILLSAGSLALFFTQCELSASQRTLIFDFTIFGFVLFFCFIIWLTMRAAAVKQIKVETDLFLQALGSKLEIKVESEVEAIIRIFSRFHFGSYTGPSAIKKDAMAYFRHMPFLVSLDFKLQASSNPYSYINPTSDYNRVNFAQKKCLGLTSPATTKDKLTIDSLFVDKTGYLCINKYQMLAIIDLSSLLRRLISVENERFYVSIIELEPWHTLIRERHTSKNYLSFWERETHVNLYGNGYTIIAAPSEAYVERYFGQFPFYILLMSIVISALILITIKNKRKIYQQETELKYSEGLNYAILNSVGESVIGINKNLQAQFMNTTAQALLQIDYNADSKPNVAQILKISAKTKQNAMLDSIKKTIKNSAIIKNEREKLVTPNGLIIPVTYTSSPMLKNKKTEGAILVIHDISKQVRYEEKLKYLAHFDALTQLPNRYSILHQINASITKAKLLKKPFALCFIDINQFKAINDTYGHHVGDKTLQFVSKILKANVRRNDFIGRLSGDEFCLILEGLEDLKQIEIILQKIKKAFQTPFSFKKIKIKVQLSIGYTLYEEGMTAKALLIKADAKMYQSKPLKR